MPKDTFHKLKPEKKKRITDAFLKEFTIHDYDTASLSNVVSQLGIAKGSVYQYFEGKMDIFKYLQAECNGLKMQFVMPVQRENYDSFWEYWRGLYKAGIQFDEQHPLASNFLHALFNNMNSPSLKEVFHEWRNMALDYMTMMVQAEIDRGEFRDDLPPRVMANFIHTTSIGLYDHMQMIYGLDIRANFEYGTPIFGEGRSDILEKSMEDNISLLKEALSKR